jgi:hypothetical protein
VGLHANVFGKRIGRVVHQGVLIGKTDAQPSHSPPANRRLGVYDGDMPIATETQ